VASRFECPRCQTVFVRDVAGDAAFVECPSCGALALPAGDATEGMLAALSATQPSQPSQEQPPEMSDPALAAPAASAGVFSGLLQERSDPQMSVPAPTPGLEKTETLVRAPPEESGKRVAPDLDIDWNKDLGDFDFPWLPTTSPPRETPAARPAQPVTQLPPDALAALASLPSGEGDPEEEPTTKGSAPWSALSDEAFGDLERAFDDLALKPQPPPRGRLSDDEERFLRGESQRGGGGPPARPPPRKKAPGEVSDMRPPPRRGGGGKSAGPRPTHFQLSDKARQLAFLSALPSESSVSAPRPRVDLNDARPVRESMRPSSSAAAQSTSAVTEPSESTDLVRERKETPRRKPPSALSGVSLPLVIVLMFVSLGLGSGAGAYFLAPKPKPATPRTHAEMRLAEGNRYYDIGRFDDALGAFNAALKFDPTYAVVYRAKGAALAKLQRYDEAAEAYRAYLANEPTAIDADDAKSAIARREKPEGAR
jgi:tetratricopeptide (TPR) repeat protein